MLSALLGFQGTWGHSANPTPHFWAMLSSSYVAVPEEDALPSTHVPGFALYLLILLSPALGD